MKFLKVFKVWDAGVQVGSLSDSDVHLLAFMCRLCEPKIIKDGFLTRHYAYYVPQDEADLEIIEDIFAKSRIPVQEHLSRILGGMEKQKVLRVDYGDVKNKDALKQEMKKIEQCCCSLYRMENLKKITTLQHEIEELKKAKILNRPQR